MPICHCSKAKRINVRKKLSSHCNKKNAKGKSPYIQYLVFDTQFRLVTDTDADLHTLPQPASFPPRQTRANRAPVPLCWQTRSVDPALGIPLLLMREDTRPGPALGIPLLLTRADTPTGRTAVQRLSQRGIRVMKQGFGLLIVS